MELLVAIELRSVMNGYCYSRWIA